MQEKFVCSVPLWTRAAQCRTLADVVADQRVRERLIAVAAAYEAMAAVPDEELQPRARRPVDLARQHAEMSVRRSKPKRR